MADNNNGYWPADNGGQPEQPQNDNLQQDAPTTSDAQDQQFAQEPLGAPQEAPAQNDDAQQPQPEAQDTRPTQPLAPVAPTSEQAQASEPTQPLQPQPTQPLYRPAPEYGAYGPTPTQPEPQQPQPTQQQNQNTGNGGNPFFNGNPFMTRPTNDASQQNRQNGNTPYGFPFGPQGPNGGQDQGMAQPEDGGNASRGGSSAASHIVTAVVAALVAAALCLGVGYFALTYGWVSTPTTTSLTNVQSNKSGTGSATAKTGEAADWKTVASEVSGSVVSIQAALSNGTAKGSGAIVSAKGYIVTNNHVISGAQQIQVTLSNGQMYTAQVVGTDTTTDLAVIKLDNPPSDLKAVEFADSDKLAVGEDVMAIGNPLGYDDTATTGIVSALNRPVTVTDDSGSDIVTNAVQIDAAINPGNSGGPTFNAAGQVIGINSSIASTATSSDSAGSIGIGFAIPSNLVKRVANEIIKDGKVRHVALGVTITTGTVEADGVTRAGAKVTAGTSGSAVVSGSPADKAGLKVGDVIVAYDGNAVSSTYSLLGYVRASALNDKVTLTIVRGGKTMDVEVTLDKEESAVNGSSSSNSNNNQNNQNNQNGNGQNGNGNGNSNNGNGNGSNGYGNNDYGNGGFSDPFGLW
ncbi:trypsin-like peptidase domain-containing protein [Bifidobacterium bifidum]|uniref:trypsin-like peptidase domain-containing protein n=1 Tax=Bifidobacterium bifidum TaxID=1681 RepID=UPI002330EE78|nr:trypsin-like peptidase domain-containing protein [Bifidobacterium bifidum]MDB1262743.1 trypsin-like peptidase domain-containing protein [Bifidobacterium bifidum]MDB1265513.1 trypsin-like peptidase domain-containing protein [Bifidobacterium bifidum]MDB1269391.1 trypsin-like peptidase domain-containing protein [Bifidobacterium bifidum]MDB1270532.1 trypsin-like peptidase domain-containing protein [Bifidobacterium bifidum]MDB1275558.1 trypsin-like peptidase domain-containing protein [Bifidobact